MAELGTEVGAEEGSRAGGQDTFGEISLAEYLFAVMESNSLFV